jgi:hypothetical protein
MSIVVLVNYKNNFDLWNSVEPNVILLKLINLCFFAFFTELSQINMLIAKRFLL